MRRPPHSDEIEIEHGERMIEVKIRFWTNNLAVTPGKVRPRHAWAKGVVRMERNGAHKIVPGSPVPFNSLLDLTSAIEKTLLKHSIRLHAPTRMRKYFDPSA
jgi:hypothetical protein